ncbi:hypothetical protein ACFP2T_16545 [Plantactinospora solaniradicis]|uniref:Uncharacterized protein n=1 Tax=Plantactinospora solaniradicis TaxID=1723736 RepID=A0ABW1K969_9ACTN
MSQPPVSPGPPYNPLGGDLPPQPPTYSVPHTRPRKRRAWPWVIGGLVITGLLCCGGLGAIGALSDDPTTNTANTAAAGTTPTTAPAATTPAATPTTTAPPPKTTPPKPAPKVTYKPLTERQWKLVAKDPDKYIGKTYIVYGSVTQFDAATGTDTFRADVGHKNMQYDFEYETNTLLTAPASKLENVVEGDEFRATVKVTGSHSYDTQIGGNTTVPMLAIASIKVL